MSTSIADGQSTPNMAQNGVFNNLTVYGTATGNFPGAGVTFTDGVNIVTNATQLTVSGATVGGSPPDATLTISGGPLTFYASLTSSQILNAVTVPVPIISAPGAGKAIIITACTYSYTFDTLPYTGGPGTLCYGGDTAVAADYGDASVLEVEASSVILNSTPAGTGQQTAAAGIDNAAITYAVPVGQPYLSGNGTLKIVGIYEIITL